MFTDFMKEEDLIDAIDDLKQRCPEGWCQALENILGVHETKEISETVKEHHHE